MSLACCVALRKAEPLLVARLQQLQARVQDHDEAAWPEFLQILQLLAALLPAVSPEQVGAMLTTAEMAARFGISAKTLLKRKCRGEIQPTVQLGKLIRWSGKETLPLEAGLSAQRKPMSAGTTRRRPGSVSQNGARESVRKPPSILRLVPSKAVDT